MCASYATIIRPAVLLAALLSCQLACSKEESKPVIPEKPPPSRPQTVLRIGRIPFRSARDMVKAHEPIIAYLRETLPYDKVQLVSAPDYQRMAQLIKEDRIDIAWMGTNNYLKLREETGVTAILKVVRRGNPYYGGLIIVRRDSGIDGLKNLKGKTFAFVDKGSASGYLYPLALLLNNGIDPAAAFKEVKFLGGHDNVVYNVFLKKVDAGAVYDDARQTLKDPKQIEELKVVARLPRIPNEPIAISKNLSRERREAIAAAFLALSLENPKTGPFLQKFNQEFKDYVNGFVRAADEDYDVVRDLQKTVDEYKGE